MCFVAVSTQTPGYCERGRTKLKVEQQAAAVVLPSRQVTDSRGAIRCDPLMTLLGDKARLRNDAAIDEDNVFRVSVS